MRVFLVNNAGGGEANYKEVADGTTLSQFLALEGVENLGKMTVRVNRENVGMDYVLKADNRVVVTPKNIEGA